MHLAAKCEHVGESIPIIEKNGFHHCITTILSYSYVFVGFCRSLEPKLLHTHTNVHQPPQPYIMNGGWPPKGQIYLPNQNVHDGHPCDFPCVVDLHHGQTPTKHPTRKHDHQWYPVVLHLNIVAWISISPSNFTIWWPTQDAAFSETPAEKNA